VQELTINQLASKKKLVKERKILSDESINQEDFEQYYAKIYRIQFSFLERQQVTK